MKQTKELTDKPIENTREKNMEFIFLELEGEQGAGEERGSGIRGEQKPREERGDGVRIPDTN